MDFYKYLIGFGQGKTYCKLQLPTGSLKNSTEYKGGTGTDSNWEQLFSTINSNYYYCIKKDANTNSFEPNGENAVQLLIGKDRDTFLNLGNILLSGSDKANLVQEVWGPLYLKNLYTNTVTGLCERSNQNKFIFNNIGTIEAADAAITATSITLTSSSAAVKCTLGSVEATYFNATSDRRAKTNISAYNGNATELVKKIPIYTFNYLTNNSPSIGMIAQEAAMFDNAIPNFSLVNNEKATGENGDYMSIKESKLVYILWKAVQEQAAKIEELEKKIAWMEQETK